MALRFPIAGGWGIALCFMMGWGCAASAGGSTALREVFRDPPPEAKPRGYWVWPHGNFDYSTLRSELAEFKAKGLGGLDLFDLGVQDRKNVIPPGPGFMSIEQVDGIAFALAEAKRLGLKMGLIVSSSWNAGGTWTPPELALMNLVAWSEVVEGPLRYERTLPWPEVPTTFKKRYGVFPLEVPRNEQGEPRYRKEVAVVAYPLDAEGRLVDPRQVRILTDQLGPSGQLQVELPAGRWGVMRTVLVNFGQRLWLPSDRSQGLTMDHFSREATRHHFQTLFDRLAARLGPLRETALERLYLASYEANAGVTWTPGFERAFAEQNGYRIEPYLPALYGVEVVDRETTERFLYDYRRTVSELFIENLYREASRMCRGQGLLLCSEAGGPGAPLHDVPTEELKALGAVDVMRGEFWHGRTNQLTPEGFEELQIVKPIASAAHIYGHRIVEMEAFTSHLNWREGPGVFKALADRAFCEGMTRVVYHTMSHNLPEAGWPGWTYQAGTHVNTHLTWWNLSDGLHRYLARTSALLMQGDFIADVAFYYGDDVPLFAKPKHVRPGLGFGYDYDDLNTEVLLQARVNRAGEIVLPRGMRYRLLVLPENERRMSLKVLEHVEQLVRRGATVLGHKPERTYGLRGYPEEQRKLQRLADRLWDATRPEGAFEPKPGRGRLIAGATAREILLGQGVGPDFAVHPVARQAQVDYLHRRVGDADVYFVRNATDGPIQFEAQFRVRGKRPELWDPDRGTMTRAGVYQPREGGIVVPLRLLPHGSVFVVWVEAGNKRRPQMAEVQRLGRTVFPGRTEGAPWFEAEWVEDGTFICRADTPGDYEVTLADGRKFGVLVPAASAPRELTGPWEVRFPAGWDVPARQAFASLHSWTDATNAATRAFSGTAVYAKQFEGGAPPSEEGRVWLDLGEVREVARVYLNGHEAGVVWFKPFVLDVTGLLRAGENSLVIEVANTWVNRLRADDTLPEDQRRTHTNLTGPTGGVRWRDAEPNPSGLLGPVRLQFVPQVKMKGGGGRKSEI